MWGCISGKHQQHVIMCVPSLYVRVYRVRDMDAYRTARSLIICEGVSKKLTTRGCWRMFPHYMWGCIVKDLKGNYTRQVPSLYVRVYQQNHKYHIHGTKVPSLYVRVYRKWMRNWRNCSSSLIICEGVSRLSGSIKTKTAVPSLYVRVYRYINTLTGKNHGSLIICEGVSVFPGRFQNQNLFPHYMWGCICDKSEWFFTEKGPSLYVRVYQRHTFIITR